MSSPKKSASRSVEERAWKRPDLPSNCVWKVGAECGDHPDDSPHHHEFPSLDKARVFDNALQCIGNTPLIKVKMLAEKKCSS